jgi:hypothetical protein
VTIFLLARREESIYGLLSQKRAWDEPVTRGPWHQEKNVDLVTPFIVGLSEERHDKAPGVLHPRLVLEVTFATVP